MKAKVTRGGGFRGVLNYVFDVGKRATGDKHPEWVGGTLSDGSVRDLSGQFAVARHLRPDIKRPVWHASLALPEGERLESERWHEVARDFMAEMGFPEDTAWVAVRHSDTKHDHIHIIASRVSLGGKVWHGKWEAREAIEATQTLEKRHGLTLTPGLGEPDAENKKRPRAERRVPSYKESNMATNAGKVPPRIRLQQMLDEAMHGNPTVVELADRLTAAGVGVRANVASTGKMNGFSFELDGIPFKGSDLGKRYTFGGLQKAGVSYEQDRDRAGLARYANANRDAAAEVEAEREWLEAQIALDELMAAKQREIGAFVEQQALEDEARQRLEQAQIWGATPGGLPPDDALSGAGLYERYGVTMWLAPGAVTVQPDQQTKTPKQIAAALYLQCRDHALHEGWAAIEFFGVSAAARAEIERMAEADGWSDRIQFREDAVADSDLDTAMQDDSTRPERTPVSGPKPGGPR